ncbi:S8 family serine peptidase [Phytomonospora endophytica]|uniref:Subtilisin family serine protease n=1 Tax=Phytomonospora endophytica TaxID=714109 RepID=A0A841FP51_9ACTN|nr:S8 family serine peptidase [Phytomonospora endophytica]MBB6035568.1 subtilisin family serine protease [Phytomonospora endophytica]GIG70069.1 serine protease [Phytomonospora endophytica]
MRIRHALALACAAVLAAGPVPASAGEPAAPVDPPWTRTAGDTSVVPLITGDRVEVFPGGTVFLPGEGREDVGFTRVSGLPGNPGDTYIVPSDARALLDDGVLDRELFNVTALARDGFGGAATLPLIVRGPESALRSLDAADGTARLGSIDATAVEVDRDGAAAFWHSLAPGRGERAMSGVRKVWLDGKARLLLEESVPQVGAPAAWEAGYTGEGSTVAVLDSGYDPGHPDLAGLVTAAEDFTGTSPGGIDDHGHGTHVASIVAGSGAASDGRRKGVAPGAHLMVGKICVKAGTCDVSAVIRGFEWAARNGADVVNASIGIYLSDGTDPMSLALNALSAETQTLFVISSGNEGADGSVQAPGSADAALTVGSVTKGDALSWFSSRGPRMGDRAVKPDILAPGEAIVAARAEGTFMGSPVDEFYTAADGTSMSSPHVAGAAAILRQVHPDWTAARLKAVLMGTAAVIEGVSVYEGGTGRLDVARAVTQPVGADAGSISFGLVAFPYEQPVSRVLTYANHSATDVTLSLGFDQESPYTLDNTTVTVPAHGTAGVTVSVDPADGVTPGLYGGVLIASDGTATVRTALGAYLEPELHRLTARIEGVTPGASLSGDLGWLNLDTGERGLLSAPESGAAAGRVPPGRYDVFGTIREEGAATALVSVAAAVTVGHDEVAFTWDLGGRRARDFALRDRPRARPEQGVVELGAVAVGGDRTGFLLSQAFEEGPVYVLPAAGLSAGFHYSPHVSFISKPRERRPWRYEVVDPTTGAVPEGGTVTVADADLAVRTAVHESQGASSPAARANIPRAFPGDPVGYYLPQPIPQTVTEYYTPAPDWEWEQRLAFADAEGRTEIETRRTTVPMGQRTTRWNRAPLGIGQDEGELLLARRGDAFQLMVPMFTGPVEGSVTSGFDVWTGETELLIDGHVLAAGPVPCFGQVPLPEGFDGDLTVRCDVRRTVPWSTVGTRSVGAWTFATAPTSDPGTWTPVGMNTVRVEASGVYDGAAYASVPQVVALDVQRPAGTAEGTASLSFEVSYDEGASWRKAPLLRIGDRAWTVLDHPDDAGSVSVRSKVTDTEGNTGEVTTIRAWNLR